CAGDHAGREGGRSDPRQATPAAQRRRVLPPHAGEEGSAGVNDATRTYGHLIRGQEIRSPELIARRNPATGDLVSRFAAGDRGDVDRAAQAAAAAFETWSQVPGAERSRRLLAAAALIGTDRERLAAIDASEVGKPLNLARADVDGCIAHFEYAA